MTHTDARKGKSMASSHNEDSPSRAFASLYNQPPTAPSEVPSSLDEMRRRMLFRSPEEKAPNPPVVGDSWTFSGRALTVGDALSQANPVVSEDDTDPHKLFQMLRKKKRTLTGPPSLQPAYLSQASTNTVLKPNYGGNTAVKPHTSVSPQQQQQWAEVRARALSTPDANASSLHSARSAGQLRTQQPLQKSPTKAPTIAKAQSWWAERVHTRDVVRPVPLQRPERRGDVGGSARPPSPKHKGDKNLHPRAVQSANLPGHDPFGRPVTRQKPPKQALDLFPNPKDASEEEMRGSAEPFPTKPASARREKKDSAPRHRSAEATEQETAPKVDFSCLFVNSDDELDGQNQLFPAQKASVDIPLIETDWFSACDWEELKPVEVVIASTRNEEPTPEAWRKSPSSDDGGAEEPSDVGAAETLYGMLVAQKARRPK